MRSHRRSPSLQEQFAQEAGFVSNQARSDNIPPRRPPSSTSQNRRRLPHPSELASGTSRTSSIASYPSSESEDEGPFDFPDQPPYASPSMFTSLATMLSRSPSSPPASTLPLATPLPSADVCFCGQPSDVEDDSIYCSVKCGREDAMRALCCAEERPKARTTSSHYRRVELAEAERERMSSWRFNDPNASTKSTASGSTRGVSSTSSARSQSTHSSAVPSLSSSLTPSFSSSSSSVSPVISYTGSPTLSEVLHLDPAFNPKDEERDIVHSGWGHVGRLPTLPPRGQHHKQKLSFDDVVGIMNH